MAILFHRFVIGYQERTLHRCWVTSIRYWGAWILTGRCDERSPWRAWLIFDAAQLGLDYPSVTILYAVAARMALHQADPPRAREELTRAQRLRPGLTYALPHLAVQARIELARVHLALTDVAGAKTLMWAVDDQLIRRPGLGVFVRQAEDLRAQLSRARGSPGHRCVSPSRAHWALGQPK